MPIEATQSRFPPPRSHDEKAGRLTVAMSDGDGIGLERGDGGMSPE